jgi:ABC-type bacteriocin/lantibiotic exporter with double-glycine peptidase domain
MSIARTSPRTSCPSAAAALAAVARLHDLPIAAEQIGPVTGLTAITGLGDLVFAARRLGFESAAIEASYDDLYEIDHPIVLAIDGPGARSFAVLRSADVMGATVEDPRTGEVRRVSRRELCARWAGACLDLVPDGEAVARQRDRLARRRRGAARFEPGPTAKVVLFAAALSLPAFAALADAVLHPHGPSAVEASSPR